MVNTCWKRTVFKNKLAPLVLLIFCAHNAGAQSLVLSCTAKAVYGRVSDLSVEGEGHTPRLWLTFHRNSFRMNTNGMAELSDLSMS